MTYYINWPTFDFDPEFDLCILGEVSFKNFWASTGFEKLQELLNHPGIEKRKEYVSQIKILDSNNNVLTIEEFLKKIDSLLVISRK